MRKFKFTSTRWTSFSSARIDALYEMICIEANREVFNKDFWKAVAKLKADLDKRILRSLVTVSTILILLAAIIFAADTKLAIFGIAPEHASVLRELLLFVFGSMSIYVALISAQADLLGEMLSADAKRKAKDNDEMLKYLKAVNSSPLGYLPWLTFPAGTGPSAAIRVITLAFAGSAILLIVMFFMAGYAIELWALYDIYKRPTFSSAVSWFVIVYNVLGMIFAICVLLLRSGKLPFTDLEFVNRLSALRENDERRYQQVINDLVRSQLSFRRWFGRRPPLPKI